MIRTQWRQCYDQSLRFGYQRPKYRREETPEVVRYLSRDGKKGFVLWSNLADVKVDDVIQREVEYFRGIGQAFEWKVYDYDYPENLSERLERVGFHVDEPLALMVGECHGVMPKGAQNIEPLEVREITTESGIHAIMQLEAEVWGRSFVDLENELCNDKKTWSESLCLYGVYDGNLLVSAAWMYLELHSEFASLWGGSTLPGYRDRGCYTALVHARREKARATGRRYLTVDASPMSRRILEKHGLVCLGYTRGCHFVQVESST